MLVNVNEEALNWERREEILMIKNKGENILAWSSLKDFLL